ncbi:flagellar hook-associated protein FlgL [Sansalvadorimonas sp. 2012CJ34-2]|uniref:Flagellar hook-associated protein FlgL n=1 Tax=Parendozoicomonas callyspongiae TaxID=2942213 RepID=A0ABT0PE25_9GAMM|nr:flagellar hook-associated protein FlgL [Sansalvadorimonas sp. 2012CJ34-2]MCL6269558.1 flagellar hook-associated protein FlgL [Sansalvadorimonas sp. 2012CJ34-2]
MRISTLQEQTSMLSHLQAATSRSNSDWNRVASGKKLNQPSDDPLSAVQILEVNRRITATDVYLQNIAALNDLLGHEDILLKEGINLVGRARDVILQSNNAAMDDIGLQAHGREVAHIIDSLVTVVNTRDADGNYLFGGHKIYDAPIVIESDGRLRVNNDNASQRKVMVTETASVSGPDNAHELCFHINDGAGGTFNLLTVLVELKGHLLTPPSDLSSRLTVALDKMDKAADCLNSHQTNLGARLNMLGETADNHREYKIFCQKLAGDLGDLDYAAAVSRLSQSTTAMDAARKSLTSVGSLSLFQYLK